jgi:tyrosine phenol-lyase
MIQLPDAKTIIEPFRIKSTEALPILSTEERQTRIKEAFYNLFFLPSRYVTFDLLTDSGTSAMSSTQWAALMNGDESYAGSNSFYRFEEAVKDLTGAHEVIPTHQGRSAEYLLMKAMVKEGQVVLGNTHFDTTRANIEKVGAEAKDLPSPTNQDTAKEHPFKGDMDTKALAAYLEKNASQVPLVIMTITNNSVGGQPVSVANIKETKEILKKHNIPMFIDAARFAENAYFIKQREEGYKDKSIEAIAKEVFRYGDGVMMSSKKDAFANIGGFLAVNDEGLAQVVRSAMVVTEGFPTYGGLAGRDLEVLAVGLKEILDENYLSYRVRSVEYFGEGIEEAGISTVRPYGGHAVYIDAGKTLSHLDALDFPGHSLSVALYEHIGLRSVEIGTVMMGRRDPDGTEHPAPKELVRLAMPRRVYTQSHVDYMIEKMQHLAKHLEELKGYEFTYQAPVLRHFTAKFRPKS